MMRVMGTDQESVAHYPWGADGSARGREGVERADARRRAKLVQRKIIRRDGPLRPVRAEAQGHVHIRGAC